jgi:GNAT superfamily N-acetyltransferase
VPVSRPDSINHKRTSGLKSGKGKGQMLFRWPLSSAMKIETDSHFRRSAHLFVAFLARRRSILGRVMVQLYSQSIEIRRAGQDDAAAVRELTRSAYAKWVPLIGREPIPMTADYDRAVREHMIDLLFIDAELAALIETVSRADYLLIENVAVLPAFQGRGYGRVLLEHADPLATSLGLPELRLYTNKQFATNIAIYRRRGYAIDREEPFRGGFVVHMSKRLGTA